MQEERQKRDEVKKIEKQFVDSTQQMIKDVFQKLIFEHHRNNIKKISECFKDNPKNLELAQDCSNKQQQSQMKVEKRIEQFLNNHQEGISNCIAACTSNIYTPMADCYQGCFQTFTEYSQSHIQKAQLSFNGNYND